MHKGSIYAIFVVIVLGLGGISLNAFAYTQTPPKLTTVELKFLADSGRQPSYPNEYIPIIETRNSFFLGKLTALRFIEWVQYNPNAVVAFTSGSTPEFFVKFLSYYKNNWNNPAVQAELRSMGINLKKFPATENLKLVQIEELYPISDKNYKKISNYILRHYVKILGIKKQNLLLMDIDRKGILAEKGMGMVFMNGKVDLSIMQRPPNSQLESWQQQAIKEVQNFCKEYEEKIRAWGGIDFFIGGLSYGGHLCFNEPGSKPDSKTRIFKLDYNTAAHAAKDFGGIEHAKGKLAITIGLGTLAIKPNAIMIVIASGQAKAEAVRNAVESKPNIKYPVSLLQKFPNTRMYITLGAAKLLQDRIADDIRFKRKHGWQQKHVEEVITNIALARGKKILSLTEEDLASSENGRMLLESPLKPLDTMLADTHNALIKKIESGLKINTRKISKILHTGPHHDDIMLGYYPLFDSLVPKYKNHFAYLTSGFNSVTDSYILSTINRASDWWLDKEKDNIFKKSNEVTIARFKNYFLRQDVEQLNMYETTLAMRHLVSIYNLKSLDELKQVIRWLKDEYFPHKQPGDLDVANIKMLKGMMRESEAERLWSIKNIPLQNITHLRSKFYSGREFMKTPRYDVDVVPFIALFKKVRPDVITVNDDPESAPPITHYRTLQIVAQGLRSKDAMVNDNLQIWGYRNIWFRYSPSEANIFVPVSEQMLAAQRRAFNTCFSTQKMASFPSPFYDGDFSTLTDMIHREQFAELKILLGADYFAKNSIPELRNAAGFVFINQMTLNDFLRRAEDLQPAINLEEAYIANKK
jgi:glucosamine-6-phosphate deaminase